MGPSLGADSIRQGLCAGLAGVIGGHSGHADLLQEGGINATLALILNAVILIAALSYFEAVLTLPGIAGVILTIGMAVDSNVLIFERIREELRAGKAVIAAVDSGIQQGVPDDHRHPRDHRGFLRFPVPVRHRSGQGICGDPGDRFDRQCVHGGVCFPNHLRLVAEQTAAGRLHSVFDIEPGPCVFWTLVDGNYEK